MNTEGDQSWLDGLAGREGGDSSDHREASALRQAMLQRAAQSAAADVKARDVAREDELIRRAQREGLLQHEPRLEGAGWGFWSGAFAVAALAGIALALGLYVERLPQTSEVVRGASDALVRLESENPAQLKQQILDELREAGVRATGYELLGRHGIDADLPAPLPVDVRSVLERHGIPPPRDNVLRLEIVMKAAGSGEAEPQEPGLQGAATSEQ